MDCADYCICGDGHRDGLECDLLRGVLNKKRAFWINYPGRLVFSLCVVMWRLTIHGLRNPSYVVQSHQVGS